MVIEAYIVFLLSLSAVLLLVWAMLLYKKLSVKEIELNQKKEQLKFLSELQDKFNDSQSDVNSLSTQLAVLNSQLKQEKELHNQNVSSIESVNIQLVESQKELKSCHVDLVALRVSQEKEQEVHKEKLALLEATKQQFSNELKLLANQILDSKQLHMSKHSKELIGGLIQPMKIALEGFKNRVETVHKEDLEGRSSLVQQLKQLQELNHQMSDETKNLTKALKGDSKLQGNWGELILEKLLESSGLREGIEFAREKHLTDEQGKRYRPDVILNLPDSKHIIIDSKVSLKHYEKAINASDEDNKSIAIKRHLNSLSRHIQSLSEKGYEHLEGINAPDFVLMFIPVEGAYLLAIESDPSVFETAFQKKVAVVTPTTLFTTLKTIEQLWRYERQSKHTVALIKRAADVHDKFVGFVESFEKVGKQLNTAMGSYEQAKKQMMSGNGNLVRQAEMLKELAGKTKKEIPKHLLEESEGEKIESN